MNYLKRGIVVFLIFLGLSWTVHREVRKLRHEHRVRSMLLVIQEGLQRYHVDQEKYIPRAILTGSELIRVLLDFEFLAEVPLNPWTGLAWALDNEEPDHLRYQTDPQFETYALRALVPDSDEILLEIDSVHHLSLE
jgi:hypothetical protein